jgi:tol-pal system protein YbgF
MRSWRLLILLPLTAGLVTVSLTAGTKEEIVRLQSDVLQLQNQIRLLQKAVDEKDGMILSLLEQLNDQVAEGRLVSSDLLAAINASRAQNSTFDESLGQIRGDVQMLNVKLDEVSNRVGSLHRKLEENQMQVQTLRTTPADLEGEVEPDRVYSASFNDYLMGNYALAISGFQDFLANYPDSEYADNAAYYLGDCYLQQGNAELAVQAFEQVVNLYPEGDKTPVAYYKKALALQGMQRLDQAISTFKRVAKLFPESPEARLAEQELVKMGVN